MEKIRMNDVEHQPREASPPADASPKAKIRWTAGVVVAMLLSGGQHGPGRHLSSAGFDARVAYSAKAASFFSGDDVSALSGR